MARARQDERSDAADGSLGAASQVERVLAAMLEVANAPDDERMLVRIVELGRELVGARYAAIGVVSDDGTELVDFVHAGMPDDLVARIGELPRGRGILGELLRDPVPLRLRVLSSHPASVGFPIDHPPMRSFLGVPLRGSARVLGNLYLTEKIDGDEFTAADQALAEAFAAQAAAAIERTHAHEAQARSASSSAALFRAVRALNETRDSAQVLQVIADVARDLADADYAALAVLAPDGTQREFIQSGMDPVDVQRIGRQPEGLGLLATVTVEGRPLRLRDLSSHPSSVGFPSGHPPMTSFLGVPIVAEDGAALGNLYLTDKRGAPEFSEEDEDRVTALAGQAALAIEHARSFEREAEMVARMRRLVDANLTLTRELRPDVVLQTLVDIARDLAGAEYAALGVVSDDGSGLEAFVHSGMDPALIERIGPLPRGRGVLQAVIVAGRPIRLHDLGAHPASVGFPAHHPPMTAFLGVPLVLRGRVFGNLYLTNKVGGGDFDDEDELVVTALAAQAAVAIQNAKVYEREQELVSELRSLDRARSEFVSTVSHELRSPLAALTGISQMLQRHHERLDQTQIVEGLEAIGRQAVRLNRLVDDLLDLSRIEQGRLSIEPRPVPLAPLVVDAVEPAAVASAKRIDADVADDIVVLADPGRLDQVLVNLVTNAVHHGGDHIEVLADVQVLDTGPDSVEIVVSDDGHGIDADLAGRLFERFVRGRNPGGGSGLGLAISRALVEAMHGTLHHERRGDRTCFVVRLRSAADLAREQRPAGAGAR